MKFQHWLLIGSLLLAGALFAVPEEAEVIIAAGTVYNGNINTTNSDITVLDGARVKGQVRTTNGDIYIEENARVKKIKNTNGDIFLDESVTVDQTITDTNGDIRVKRDCTIKGNIVTETGDIRVDHATLKKDVKTRHGSISLRDGTYVKGSIRILNRGHGANLETVDIYLGQDVYIKKDVTAANAGDHVELQMYGAEVHGHVRRVTEVENPGGGGGSDDCDGVAAWVSTQIYNNGDLVSHEEHVWKAGWWTRNNEPGTTGQNGVWQDQGPCGATTGCGGRPVWTSTAIFTAGTEVDYSDHVYRAKWWTRGDEPTEPGYHNPWEDRGACDDETDED